MKRGDIIEGARAFFVQQKYDHGDVPSRAGVIEIRWDLGSVRWRSYAQEKEGKFLLYSLCPVNAPQERRLAVAEYITRVNFGLLVGHFEMDFSDGETRFLTSLDPGDHPISFDAFYRVCEPNFSAMGRYLKGLQAVIEGRAEPAQAAADAEEDT